MTDLIKNFEVLLDNKKVLLIGPAAYIENKSFNFNDYDIIAKINRTIYKELGFDDRCDVLYSNIHTSKAFGEVEYDYHLIHKKANNIRVLCPPVNKGFKQDLKNFLIKKNNEQLYSIVSKEKYLDLKKKCNNTSPNSGSIAIYDLLKTGLSHLHISGITMFFDGYASDYRKKQIDLNDARKINKKTKNHNTYHQAKYILSKMKDDKRVLVDEEVLRGFENILKIGPEW